jgi:Tol biopolymer transport system component
MNLDGSGLSQLTNNSSNDNRAFFSPDGTKIAFTSNRDGNEEIYTMNTDGSNQTKLTSNAAIDQTPSWSGYLK